MPESFVQVTEGSGKKLHTFQRTVGVNTVEDEVVLSGEPYLPSYVVSTAGALNVSTATLGDHLIQLMAGPTLSVRVRRILIVQKVLASAATIGAFDILRVTTAGSGGTPLTPRPLDTADTAANATARAVPSPKGVEGVSLLSEAGVLPSAATQTSFRSDLNFDLMRTKPIIIPAGSANGIVIKNGVAIASATLAISIWFDEVA